MEGLNAPKQHLPSALPQEHFSCFAALRLKQRELQQGLAVCPVRSVCCPSVPGLLPQGTKFCTKTQHSIFIFLTKILWKFPVHTFCTQPVFSPSRGQLLCSVHTARNEGLPAQMLQTSAHRAGFMPLKDAGVIYFFPPTKMEVGK